jgi:DNA-binding transcriptional LysR family regulator
MELMQLEMFVAVAERGSILKASERVFRTQPAVSIAIKKLENEINAKLFDRSRRYEFRLTEVGEAFYGYATRLLSLRSEAMSAVAELTQVRTGRLRVGANESISINLLPRLTQAFLARYPGVQIEVQCDRSERLLRELKDRRLDLALLSFVPDDDDLDSQFVMQDELVLIASPLHRLAGRRRVLIGDLAEESVIVMDSASVWHRNLVDTFVRSKARLNLTVDNAPIETAKRMVALGLGVGFVPRMCVLEETIRGELVTIEVEGLREERSLSLVRRRATHSHAAQAFIQVAVSFGTRALANEAGFALKPTPTVVSQLVKRDKLAAARRPC